MLKKHDEPKAEPKHDDGTATVKITSVHEAQGIVTVGGTVDGEAREIRVRAHDLRRFEDDQERRLYVARQMKAAAGAALPVANAPADLPLRGTFRV